ncbi:MAG: lipoprotein signal peptidase [Bacteroidota bacterium]
MVSVNWNLLRSRRFLLPVGVIIVLLVIDQFIKVYIKTHFQLGETVSVFGDWFKLHFVENPGMAYGMKLFEGMWGKLLLTFFRMIVASFGIWYLYKSIENKAHKGLIGSITLIIAGALGNIIDSIFYGVIFSDINMYHPTGWFQGWVVDMFYAPLWEGFLPQWLPFWGGDFFTFFAPIWNFADACITVGVAIMIIGQNTFFNKSEMEKAFH